MPNDGHKTNETNSSPATQQLKLQYGTMVVLKSPARQIEFPRLSSTHRTPQDEPTGLKTRQVELDGHKSIRQEREESECNSNRYEDNDLTTILKNFKIGRRRFHRKNRLHPSAPNAYP